MENFDNINSLENFLKDEDKTSEKNADSTKENQEKVIIQSKSGLIERIEKRHVTEDGRELLKEIYR